MFRCTEVSGDCVGLISVAVYLKINTNLLYIKSINQLTNCYILREDFFFSVEVFD